jgi:hypothetical protein
VTIALMPQFDPHMRPPYCAPEGSSTDQRIRIFVKYANEHPERLHFAAEAIVIESLAQAYPCKR